MHSRAHNSARFTSHCSSASGVSSPGRTGDLNSDLMDGCLGVRVDFVVRLRDDRHVTDAIEQPLGEPVDLCRGCLAAGEDAEVDAYDDLRLFGPRVVAEGELRLTLSALPDALSLVSHAS